MNKQLINIIEVPWNNINFCRIGTIRWFNRTFKLVGFMKKNWIWINMWKTCKKNIVYEIKDTSTNMKNVLFLQFFLEKSALLTK